MTIFIKLDRLSSIRWLRRRFFINFMSEKLRSADAVVMGIDKHMVASLCKLGNNAISMSLVSNSFSCIDISSFGFGGTNPFSSEICKKKMYLS